MFYQFLISVRPTIRPKSGCVMLTAAGLRVVEFGPYLREIAALGIDGAMSIELEYSPEPEKIDEWVKEAYVSTDRLMREYSMRK